jgi:hypothetical protein
MHIDWTNIILAILIVFTTFSPSVQYSQEISLKSEVWSTNSYLFENLWNIFYILYVEILNTARTSLGFS